MDSDYLILRYWKDNVVKYNNFK